MNRGERGGRGGRGGNCINQPRTPRLKIGYCPFPGKPTTTKPMPSPLTWDTPGLIWDSAAAWDGVAANPTKPKTMSNTKANIDFSGYSAAELGPIAHSIHDQMTANAATFTAPTI